MKEASIRKALQSEARNEQLQGLYFDVSKDETLVINTLRSKFFCRPKKKTTIPLFKNRVLYTLAMFCPLWVVLVILRSNIFVKL